MSRGLALAALSPPCLRSRRRRSGQWCQQLALSADADSNRRLLSRRGPSEAGVVGGMLAIARITEISTFALMPRASISRYSGEDALDSEDWGVQALFRRKGERLEFDVQAGVRR